MGSFLRENKNGAKRFFFFFFFNVKTTVLNVGLDIMQLWHI